MISNEFYCNIDLRLKVKSSDSMPSFIQQVFVFCIAIAV